MSIVDDRGHLLGRLNIVDALVVLLVVAAAVAGAALVAGTGGGSAAEPVEATVTVHAAVPPYVLAAIQPGEVPAEGVTRVTGIEELGTVERAEMDAAGTTTYHRVALTLIVTAEGADGDLAFRGGDLYVGRELQLDLGRTVVDGVIVDYAA